jgi:hypothetical protein
VHEVFLNADHRPSQPAAQAESIFVTLIHEACHVWAQLSGVRDVSRDGRYHNRRLAEISLTIGLGVEKNEGVGHRTHGLSAWGRAEYADLVGDLERGLVLARQPRDAERCSDTGGAQERDDNVATALPGEVGVAASKYVFATCGCRDGRGRPVTIRVAKGSWRPMAIGCSICSSPFTPSL